MPCEKQTKVRAHAKSNINNKTQKDKKTSSQNLQIKQGKQSWFTTSDFCALQTTLQLQVLHQRHPLARSGPDRILLQIPWTSHVAPSPHINMQWGQAETLKQKLALTRMKINLT